MKQWLMMCFSLVFTLLVTPVAASADNPEPEDEVSANDYSLEIQGLISEWVSSQDNSDMISPGFPDNVGHIYFDDEKETVIVGLVDNDQSARDKIRSMVDDPQYLTFESSKYTYNDLIRIFRELHKEDEDDDAVYNITFAGDQGTAYDNPTDKQFGASGHEKRVYVEVDESQYDEYKEKYEKAYGDKVYVEPVDPGDMQGEGTGEDSGESALPGYEENYDNTNGTGADQVWISVLLFVALAFFALVVYLSKRRRLVAIRQTGHGNVTESKRVSRKQVASAVKDSGIKPDRQVDEAILKQIRDRESSE